MKQHQQVTTSYTLQRMCFTFLPPDQIVYLFMDNTEGHRKESVIKNYVEIFAEHNNIVEFQIPNSPKTNLLELRFWAVLQSFVEYHFGFTNLSNTSIYQFNNTPVFNLPTALFCNIYYLIQK